MPRSLRNLNRVVIIILILLIGISIVELTIKIVLL